MRLYRFLTKLGGSYMYRSVWVFLPIILLLTLFNNILPVWAQSAGSTTSSVTGVVTDEQGAIISGVVVTARNLQTNFTREAQTSEDGSFLIPQLPPGTYDLTVTAEGFTTKTS